MHLFHYGHLIYYLCLKTDLPFFPIGSSILHFMIARQWNDRVSIREALDFLLDIDPNHDNLKYGLFPWRKRLFQRPVQTICFLLWSNPKLFGVEWEPMLCEVSDKKYADMDESSIRSFWLSSSRGHGLFYQPLYAALENPEFHGFAVHVVVTEEGSSVYRL